MRKLLAVLFGLGVAATLCVAAFALPPVLSPVCNIFNYGSVPTSLQWKTCIGSLQTALGYAPVNKAGDYMTGPLGVIQILGNSGQPIVAAGAGAGTSPTVTIPQGFDSDFKLSVLTGSGPTGSNAIIATVTFSSPYQLNPVHCTFSPQNNNAAALAVAAHPYAASGVGPPYATWVMTSGATALAATTTYIWEVICQG